jgi:flavin reductase (DIM6/NTAB) family NADH-FMN oxidoreductase RutF
VIDRDIKRSLGQMMKGVQVVGAAHDGVERAYCSHWVCQVSFDEPIVMASVSPKHDTHPLIVASGVFSVSLLAADQVDVGQYFSYPGRKFRYLAPEYLDTVAGLPVVHDAIAWLRCEVIGHQRAVGPDGPTGAGAVALDHDLFFARVTAVGEGRIGAPPLLYSSRLGWRATGDKARRPVTRCATACWPGSARSMRATVRDPGTAAGVTDADGSGQPGDAP